MLSKQSQASRAPKFPGRTSFLSELNHALEQLNRKLKYLNHHDLRLEDSDIWVMVDQYGRLNDVLLEANAEACCELQGR